MNLRISKSKLRKTVASVLVPLLLLINQPIAALAAPQPPMPPSVPKFSQTPKGVRIGPKSLKPVTPRTLPIHPTDLELRAARVFEEPLIPMTGPPVAGENDALAAAVQQFKAAKNIENVAALTSFLKNFPKSRWAPAVQLNLGLLRFQSGYMTEALQLWQAAWSTTKNEKGQLQKAIADRCVAEILVLDAKVGRKAEIEGLLKEVKGRAFQGSVEQRIRGASDAVTQMRLHPEKSYKCGPHAVSALLTIKKGKYEFNKTIDDYPSTEQGTSLLQNVELAEKVGLKLQIAKRSPGADIVIPSIAHWRLGHFAAVTAKVGDRYEIKDPTFGTEVPFKITKQVFDAESDGYALIPAGPLPAGWQSVSKEEGAKVFGKGVPWIWPDYFWPCCTYPKKCETAPMMQFDVYSTSTDLHLYDTPLSYSCPIGGTVGFEVNYQYLMGNQPSIYTFTSVGANWAFEYLSYLTLDVSSTATVRLPKGFSEVYVLSGGVYKRDRLTQALLVNMGGGVYQRQMPDGSIQEYSLSDGASPAKIFMTKIIDPQGNETLIQFDADFRITTITDPIGDVSTLTYVSNTFGNSGFYNVSQISDPFSRTCSFTYDSSNTNLVMTTDVIGLQSKMIYDTTGTFVTSLETPYGITSFYKYIPTTSYNARGLKINYPDGTSSVLESWIGHEPLDATFIWDREAMELYPDDVENHDFTHAHKVAWLWGPVDGYLWPIVDYVKPALENRIEYSYVDEGTSSGGRGTVGTDTTNKPIKISQVASTPVQATIGGTKTTSDILTLTFADAALPGGSQNVAYTVQSADTLTTIASALATAVNTNANLKKLGVTAAATGSNIAMISHSSNLTAYSKSLSGGATETIALATVLLRTT